MTIRITATLSAVLILAAATPVGASGPALAPEPNRSIALYKAPAGGKPGKLWTGTLIEGVFTQKRSFTTGRWSDIAVGRDTMALYDKKSGKLVTGTFKTGIFKQKAARTVAKGYGLMAASCDSLALYKADTGQLLTAELTSGQVRDLRRKTITVGHALMEASCDTLYMVRTAPGARIESTAGDLQLGHYVAQWSLGSSATIPGVLAANRTSYVEYRRPTHDGAWGRLVDGVRDRESLSSEFRTWDLIAGVGDGVVFYDAASGLTGHWHLVNGLVSGHPDATWKQKALSLIAGGR